MHPFRRNIELKARCGDLDSARAAAASVGARFAKTMTQVDTYFRVEHGRLKLREIDDSAAELIWYDRPDAAEYRGSRYVVVPVPDPAAMILVLSAANGLRGEVRKTRELWTYHNVRVHLDRVTGLGNFVEFEAVMTEGEDDETSRRRLDELHAAMNLEAATRESRSYSDLLGL